MTVRITHRSWLSHLSLKGILAWKREQTRLAHEWLPVRPIWGAKR